MVMWPCGTARIAQHPHERLLAMTLRITPIGTDARLEACRCTLQAHAQTLCAAYPSVHTLYILPIPSSRDGVHVNSTETPLLSLVAPDTVAVGYGLPHAFTDAMEQAGAQTVDVAADEAFTQDNAYLTALATLSYLLDRLPRAPHELSVGIVGYGRIGRALCRLLVPLGARLRVYTRRPEVRTALGGCGIESADSGSDTPLDFTALDVLINTAPARGLIHARCTGLPPVILELASGDTIAEDVPHVTLPSLPARSFPYSAGVAYARCVLRAADAARATDKP